MNLDKDIDRKILDYFNGQLSTVEEVELIHWLNSNENNKTYFFNLKENLDPKLIQHPLLESSFLELKNKILIANGFNSKLINHVKTFRFSFLRIAAMLAIALLAGFSLGYFFTEPQSKKTEVVWFETQVPSGEKSQLQLPDGSKVWVNSDSKVSYPSNYMEGNREIKLTGEAYFEVAKFAGMPCTVITNDYTVRVLGTKFNVMAYADFGRTETSLIEGKIEISKGEQTIPVIPGETFTYSGNKYSISKRNASQTALWKDDVFDFERITFKELMIRLERWYDVEIVIKNAELNDIVYSGIFKNEETIWQVLNTIQLTLPIQYKRVDFRKFIIEKKN